MKVIINGVTVVNDISGEKDWDTYSVDVSAGDTVNVYASYSKDASVNQGEDRGYVKFEGTANFNVSSQYSSGSESGGALGGWQNCEARMYLKTDVYPYIPENIRNAIVPVVKVTAIYNENQVVVNGQVTVDDIWIPSHHELGFGTTRESSGPVYSVFEDQLSRAKCSQDTVTDNYFTRSVSDRTSHLAVGVNGLTEVFASNTPHGIVIGFCI